MLKDAYGRNLQYLRVSLTDQCNLRCQYCMPAEGLCFTQKEDRLSTELLEIVHTFIDLGITKIRLTGGEPMLRPDFDAICQGISQYKEMGLEQLCVTTNGLFLEREKDLLSLGVDRWNLSLDTLDPNRYATLTRGGDLARFLRGLERLEASSAQVIKLNTVLLGGINDDEIEALYAFAQQHQFLLRFIELMPMGEAQHWPKEAFLSCETVLERMGGLERFGVDGVAELWKKPEDLMPLGLIRPISCRFCQDCNRLRLTADGKLKTCLHSYEEIPLRGLSEEERRRQILTAIDRKAERHHLEEGASQTPRWMSQIGG